MASTRHGALLLASALVACARSAAGAAEGADRSVIPLPTQFSATVTTTAHLVDTSKDYPPARKVMRVLYDKEKLVAAATIVEGHDEGKTFLRRYDEKREYMVRGGPFPTCQRAYLGEDMPPPELPGTAERLGIEHIGGVACTHWVIEGLYSTVHVYLTVDGVPRRVVDEYEEDGSRTPVMTTDFTDVRLGPQDMSAFALPAPYAHETCHRQIGGFPYIHAFHYFIRF